MSRYYDWLETVTPEEYPEPFHDSSGERSDAHMDLCEPRGKWSQADVWIYRQALADLGFSPEKIDAQIVKDCGAEFSERPLLTVRQAG